MTSNTDRANLNADVEDILRENGGLGDWEKRSNSGSGIDRWLFPRFTPDCTVPESDEVVAHGAMDQDPEDGAHFTCSVCSRSLMMDPGDMYLSRQGIGYDTDVETLAAWLAAPRNRVGGVLLLGEPGCGKTALAQAATTYAERKAVVITATPDHTKDSLMMKFVGEGNGIDGTPFTYAALVEAVLNGYTIIIDEFLLFVDGVKPIFYPLLDGSHWLPEAMADGSAAAVHPETRVIVTANPQVRGASLPEPIASRFAGTTLHVETSADMLNDLGIDESIVQAWVSLGTSNLWRPQIRELRAADYWMRLNPTQAASCFLPEHCPESQRNTIANIVTGFIGGELPGSGRLVVS